MYRCHVIKQKIGSNVLPDFSALTTISKDNTKFLI